jgi:glycosyltransferase involved in cell wall biosynthesis
MTEEKRLVTTSQEAGCGTLVVISQVYVPDAMAVGQQLADAAEEMARRGWRVIVYTSNRGYDDPDIRFPSRERRGGVEIYRLPLSSFGKTSIPIRLLAQSLFLGQAVLRTLFVSGLTAVLTTTSPPFGGAGGGLTAMLRRCASIWWVMDINPDQMIAAGKVGPKSFPVRMFDWLNRFTLRRARDVIVLDRFMAERVLSKLDVGSRMRIIPPWAHEQHLEVIPHAENPFRREQGLDGKCVVMYSGNAGLSTPLDTLLLAAKRLEHDPRFHFMFIGGGIVKRQIDEMVLRESPRNISCPPYQPLDQIRYSLSAADVHVVSIGDDSVGIIHPCKIYGAMALGKPILALGPDASHLGDIVRGSQGGWIHGHGDVDGVVKTLERFASLPQSERDAIGARAKGCLQSHYRPAALLGHVCDIIAGERQPQGRTQ